MQLSEVFNSASIAMYQSEVESNRIPFLGEAFFPNKKKMGIDLKWIKTHKGLGVALKPSAFDAIPTVRGRGQAQMTKEEMPFFRESMIIKENDMMEISRATDSNDPYLQPVLDNLYDDASQLVDGAEISAEKMRMQLLAPSKKDGLKINVALADNTMYTYDYDSDKSWSEKHFKELSGTSAWTDKTQSKPLNDIRTATQYLRSIGVQPTMILGNSTTFDYLLENEQMKNALLSITGQSITFMDDVSAAEVLRRKLGLEWVAYDKMYTDYDGEDKKFYPDDYVTIIGSGQLGSTWRGTTPEELTNLGFMNVPQAPVDITVLENGVAVAVQNEYKPAFTVTTTASQIVLPSFEGMDSIYVLKVKGDD